MIQLVWERAIAADIAPVYVATDDRDIANVITSLGGKAVMTRLTTRLDQTVYSKPSKQ